MLAPATVQDISKLPEKLVNGHFSVIKIINSGSTKLTIQEPTFISVLLVSGKDLEVNIVAPFKTLKEPGLTLKRLFQRGTNNIVIKYDNSVPLEAYLIMETQTSVANLAADTKLPSLGSQIASFGTAVKDHIKNKAKLAGEEELKRRVELCEACEYKLKNRCKKCGCNLAVKQKWESSKCPDRRW
jgi:hypothetical protein